MTPKGFPKGVTDEGRTVCDLGVGCVPKILRFSEVGESATKGTHVSLIIQADEVRRSVAIAVSLLEFQLKVADADCTGRANLKANVTRENACVKGHPPIPVRPEWCGEAKALFARRGDGGWHRIDARDDNGGSIPTVRGESQGLDGSGKGRCGGSP